MLTQQILRRSGFGAVQPVRPHKEPRQRKGPISEITLKVPLRSFILLFVLFAFFLIRRLEETKSFTQQYIRGNDSTTS